MRTVAILTILASFLATLPAHADTANTGANECATNAAAAIVCVDLDAASQGSPVPSNAHYYLWLGVGKCIPPTAADCRGTPAGAGSTVGLFGLLYQESNGLGGLQRSLVFAPEPRQADKMVLI